MSYLASLDQSTTSTKFSIYQLNGNLIAQNILEHKQITPNQGYLEHDPIEIIQNVQLTMINALEQVKQKIDDFQVKQIIGLGVTNQRETVVCWDPTTGKPYHNAIVWCDTRCKEICQHFSTAHGSHYRSRTGLPVSTYFTFFKIRWLIENVPEVRLAIQNDRIRFGTIDTWVVYNLTGRYVTDASNASRTYLCGLNGEWDKQLVELAGLKPNMLAQIVDSFGAVGKIQIGPLAGVEVRAILGDQQSSAYAHQLAKNEVKITYGTGCFLLANIGKQPKINPAFITTIMYRNKGVIQYAFQCAVECGGGTLNWARKAKIFAEYNELNNLMQEINKEEVYFFPSFGQIYAPFWKGGVKGGLVGVSLATSREHILIAILESILFRVYDNLRLPQCEDIKIIYADGGITRNDWAMRRQCDLLKKPLVLRDRDTCWGVAQGVLTSSELPFPSFADQSKTEYQPKIDDHEKLVNRYFKWNGQRNRFYGWKQQ